MKHPEASSQPSTFSAFENKIRYEYNGNYSKQIRLNPAVLREIHKIIGVPNKSFVIKNGSETSEGTEMHMTEYGRGHEIKQHKLVCKIEETDNEVILTINSQVIDGRVQNEQRSLDKKNEEISYKNLFTTYLKDTLAAGISVWTFGELSRFPFWERLLKRKRLGKLFIEKGDSLVMIDGN